MALRWSVTLLLAVVFTFVGCPASSQTLGSDVQILNPHLMDPTPMHVAVYEMMEECTGQEGDPERVTWWVAQAIVQNNPPTMLKGLWTTRRGRREIILEVRYMWDATTLSHESLHDLYGGEAPMDMAERCILRPWALVPTPRFPDTEPGGAER